MTKTLFILSGTLWLLSVSFIAYAAFIQTRQQKVLRLIAKHLRYIEQALASSHSDLSKQMEPPQKDNKSHHETIITIDKNEPLSKYETVTLPDEIDINFVDR